MCVSRCDRRFYVWDILHSSIRKVNKQVAKLQVELEDLKDRKDEADNKVSDGLDIDDDVPTEETIENCEERLEAAQSDQKNLFLIIFQVLVSPGVGSLCVGYGHGCVGI